MQALKHRFQRHFERSLLKYSAAPATRTQGGLSQKTNKARGSLCHPVRVSASTRFWRFWWYSFPSRQPRANPLNRRSSQLPEHLTFSLWPGCRFPVSGSQLSRSKLLLYLISSCIFASRFVSLSHPFNFSSLTLSSSEISFTSEPIAPYLRLSVFLSLSANGVVFPSYWLQIIEVCYAEHRKTLCEYATGPV